MFSEYRYHNLEQQQVQKQTLNPPCVPSWSLTFHRNPQEMVRCHLTSSFSQTTYKAIIKTISEMKLSKLLKKQSTQTVIPSPGDNQTKVSKIWGKHSLIFSQSKTQFMHGLLALVQKKAISLSESFEQEEHTIQIANTENENKNGVQTNPFLMAKARLLKQKESLQTQNSSLKDKLHYDIPLENVVNFEDKKTVTWKQMLALEKKNKKVVGRALTDRK